MYLFLCGVIPRYVRQYAGITYIRKPLQFELNCHFSYKRNIETPIYACQHPKSALLCFNTYVTQLNQRMPRPYRPLLPLWYYQERLLLSERHPSGLEWAINTARYRVGDMAGKWTGKYYVLRLSLIHI